MKHEIKNRFTGRVQFTAEIVADENTPYSIKLGLAVQCAIQKKANLSGANLSGANLSGANLSGANLSRADLSGANLSGADLSGANLSRANLSRANLSGADLFEANLSRANLSRANLYRADLYRADLSGADLSGADLYRADLSGADLSGADLSGADLSGAIGNMEEIKNLLIEQYPITYTSTHMAIGCQQHSIEEWRRMTQKQILEMEGRKALKWWKKWKPVIFQIIEMSEGT